MHTRGIGTPTGPQARARALHAALTALRADLRGRAAALQVDWPEPPERDGLRASMANLADWLALRQSDLGPLQGPLAALGVSSLGRCEGHVLASIDAVLATLSQLADLPGPRHPPATVFTEARRRLEDRRDALFGAARDGSPSTRIMVTLPVDAATGPAFAAGVIAAGADCLRINTAHDSPADWARMAAHARTAAAVAGQRVPLMLDLAGPKLRIAAVNSREKIRLHPGDRFGLAPDIPLTRHARPRLYTASLSHPAVLEKRWGRAMRSGSMTACCAPVSLGAPARWSNWR